jgi:HAD superfamily hydrolase (TIGR01490 family)
MTEKKSEISYCAFFDVDGTIINTRSLLSFLVYLRAVNTLEDNLVSDFLRQLKEKFLSDVSREQINEFYYSFYGGFQVDVIASWGQKWFLNAEGATNFYNKNILLAIQKHRDAGAKIVLVTGSFYQVLEPLATKIKVDAILCSRLEIRNGIFTGLLVEAPCIGARKAQVIREYTEREKIDLSTCFAYGDDSTDQAMLDLVGHPVMLQPSRTYLEELERVFGETHQGSASLHRLE